VEELYDHENDPGEWTNLAGTPEHKAIKEQLKKQVFDIVHAPKPMPKVQSVQPKPEKKWDWFGTLDTNKDQGVTEGEWLTWNKKSDMKKGENFNEEQHRKYFAQRDGNDDGVMTRAELEASQK